MPSRMNSSAGESSPHATATATAVNERLRRRGAGNKLPALLKALQEDSISDRPVARIFRRGVTWMCNLYKHTRLGGSGGMLPQEIFRN